MKCLVCQATWDDREGQTCTQCGYDHAAAEARNPQRIQIARDQFRERASAYAPEDRVTGWDKAKPYVAILLGIALLLVFFKACSMLGHGFW
ncbi:MAG TPA: hypothetical protein VMZ28_08620 [Kofleriaceae bacterium]|nr:hypothetical protein [Kofleriaceae bacterium]